MAAEDLIHRNRNKAKDCTITGTLVIVCDDLLCIALVISKIKCHSGSSDNLFADGLTTDLAENVH